MQNRPHAIFKTMNTYISHVLSFSTTNGGQPRTYSVIIYLQKLNFVPLFVQFLIRGCPYQCLGCSLMGFTRSTKYVSIFYRHCGTFTGL